MLEAVIDSEINKEYEGSDHCPISLTLDKERIRLLDGKRPAPSDPLDQIIPKAPIAKTHVPIVERERGLVD